MDKREKIIEAISDAVSECVEGTDFFKMYVKITVGEDWVTVVEK